MLIYMNRSDHCKSPNGLTMAWRRTEATQADVLQEGIHMDRQEVLNRLRQDVAINLADIEAQTGLTVAFRPPQNNGVVAQYFFDTGANSATVFLRADWADCDVAHELEHMRMELLDGYNVLAWRNAVTRDPKVEQAFARVRDYVDDEVVHRRLQNRGFKLDGEVLKPQMFDNIFTKVLRYLKKLKPRAEDGMAHLDAVGYGELCRASFLVRAELIVRHSSSALPHARIKRAKGFISEFRTHRANEANKADAILKLFDRNDVMTIDGHKEILCRWTQLEGLDSSVGPSVYQKQGGRFILPWP